MSPFYFMEEVFGYYDSSLNAPASQPDRVTLWERSWRNRGWKPRLLTSRHARRSKLFKRWGSDPSNWPLLALHAVGGGWLVPFQVINFSFPPAAKGTFYLSKSTIERMFRTGVDVKTGKFGRPVVPYPFPAWTDAPLVYFERPGQVLNCGRII